MCKDERHLERADGEAYHQLLNSEVFSCPEAYHEDFAAKIRGQIAEREREEQQTEPMKLSPLMRLKPITYLAAMFVGFLVIGNLLKVFTPADTTAGQEKLPATEMHSRLLSVQEDMAKKSLDYFNTVDMYDTYLEEQAAESVLATYFCDNDAAFSDAVLQE